MNLAQKITTNQELFKDLEKAGIIDPKWSRDLEIWLEFHDANMSEETVMRRYYKISIKRNISIDTVRRAVKFFEEN